MQSKETIEEMLSNASRVISEITSTKMQNLYRLKSSPQYVSNSFVCNFSRSLTVHYCAFVCRRKQRFWFSMYLVYSKFVGFAFTLRANSVARQLNGEVS